MNDRTNHVYNDIIGLNELFHEDYPISPVNDDVLSASASPNYVTYATYANFFITPSIVTTMTSLVFYFYEFDELSTNEHTTSAFQLQLSWTMTIIVVAAYVLMIAANGILLQTKVGNFYMSTQWSMESTFVKLLLIVWNDITNLCIALSLHTSRNHLAVTLHTKPGSVTAYKTISSTNRRTKKDFKWTIVCYNVGGSRTRHT